MALFALHLVLLLLALPDYRTSVDNGYHVSLARLYGEHGVAFWDPLNYGPAGRPNLNAPLQHAIVGAAGRLLGGRGDDYVRANDVLAVIQWACAMLTVVFFARRAGGDGTALVALCVASGSAFAAGSFYVGIPSGWVFVLTPWAIHFFLTRRLAWAVVATAGCIGFHLGGYATAPLGVVVAAALTGRWRDLAKVGAGVALLSAPYSIHLLRYLHWYQGERGHVALVTEPFVLVFFAVGFFGALRRARREPFLLAWLVSGIAWLALHPTRFVLQCALAGSVAGSVVLMRALARLSRRRLATVFAGALAAAAVLFPAAPPSLGAEAIWLLGFDFPRQLDWREIRALAEAIERAGLQQRLFSVYNTSFGSALSAYTPLTQEKGHWVEVRPVPDPADRLLPGDKVYVVPLAPGDEMLRELDAAGLVVSHGGSATMAVMSLPTAPDLAPAARRLGPILAIEVRWLARHAERNSLGNPIALLLEEGGLEARRQRFSQQRTRAGRLLVAWLAYANALAGVDPAAGIEAASISRGLGGVATFIGDEASVDFIDAPRHELFRENLERAADSLDTLATRPADAQARRDLDRLLTAFFWAA